MAEQPIEQSLEHAHAVSERIAPGSVSVARIAPRRYQGLNERGATVTIGGEELEGEHFTPGELLKIALVGCAGLSADTVAARRLGDDFAMTIWAHGRSNEENRYARIDEEILVDLSVLDPEDRDKLIHIMDKAIERGCTVARSIEDSVELRTTIDGVEV
ncbi:putative OsmC-like protein [Agromyces sp. 3263]|uniref:OsmC family protein n=1 Tax=Agromyces sp. 3263 TaxID=2817750 RepID=UPI00285C868F|nr:OsmC family protein [Agromyces sp. 3263]MDR6906679.1 putative OsmC-like protein [Agromyces sp. 3263]